MNAYRVWYIKAVFLVVEKASSGTLGQHLTAEVHSRCENHCLAVVVGIKTLYRVKGMDSTVMINH